jgi:hypothetical protein
MVLIQVKRHVQMSIKLRYSEQKHELIDQKIHDIFRGVAGIKGTIGRAAAHF